LDDRQHKHAGMLSTDTQTRMSYDKGLLRTTGTHYSQFLHFLALFTSTKASVRLHHCVLYARPAEITTSTTVSIIHQSPKIKYLTTKH